MHNEEVLDDAGKQVCLSLSIWFNFNVEMSRQDRLKIAEEQKQEGNEHFRAKRWNEALFAYRNGLGQLPRRRRHDPIQKEEDEADSRSSSPQPEVLGKGKAQEPQVDETEESETDRECAKVRAVLNSNIGACHVKLVSAPYC